MILAFLLVWAAGQSPDHGPVPVTGVEMRRDGDTTRIRLRAAGPMAPQSLVRGEERMVVSLGRANIEAVRGVWGVKTAEIRSVRIETTGEGRAELLMEVGPGVICNFDETEDGLEVACRSPQPPASDRAGSSAPSAAAAPPGERPEEAEADPLQPPATGEAGGAARVTLDFRDADIRDVLRVLGEVSGLDFILQPSVSGRISLRLSETPWDRALDVILRSRGFGWILDGAVLRVGTLAELAAEETERVRREEERELAGVLVTRMHRLAHIPAGEIGELLEERLSERGSVVADARTGTVLIHEVEGRMPALEAILAALDVPVPGVEIEARIVLTTRTRSRSLGIQWGGEVVRGGPPADPSAEPATDPGEVDLRVSGGALGGSGTAGFVENPGGGLLPPAGPDGGRPGYAVNLPVNTKPTGALGIALGALVGVERLDLALTAAERRGELRILSAPRIVAQNARSATIKQGVTFPVQVVANNTVTVQFQDAVLELTVTPEIGPDGTILLDLNVNNDSLDFGQSVGGIPSILTQQATTRIRVSDGETTVLGGVFVNQESNDRQRVPFLHRIPLLGRLFRSSGSREREEELLIFLTPRIRDSVGTTTVSGQGE